MARPKNPTTPVVPADLDPQAVQASTEALNTLSLASEVALLQSDLFRAVGQIESAHFLETVSTRVIGEAYVKARSSLEKLGSFTLRKADGTSETVSTIEAFCELVMPVSGRRCRQIVQAMHTLGPALFEQAEQMGLGHRNYVAIRALPSDMQDEMKAVIASGDRDQVLTLLEELAARNASLTASHNDLEKAAAAKDKIIAKKNAKLDQLAEAEEIRRNGTPDEREKQQIADLRDAGIAAELALQRLVTCVAEVMNAPATEAAELQARQTLDFIAQRLADLCADAHVAVDVLGERVEPGWRRQITDLVAAAAQAANGKRGGRA
ncbi:MAG: hypothetical protein AMXMBFR78_34130 [Rubrivivax sp.]